MKIEVDRIIRTYGFNEVEVDEAMLIYVNEELNEYYTLADDTSRKPHFYSVKELEESLINYAEDEYDEKNVKVLFENAKETYWLNAIVYDIVTDYAIEQPFAVRKTSAEDCTVSIKEN